MKASTLTKTLQRQRAILEVSPIHVRPEPVHAYAEQVAAFTGQTFHVVTIPEGSAAYRMGYRFASVPGDELDHYLQHGAVEVMD